MTYIKYIITTIFLFVSLCCFGQNMTLASQASVDGLIIINNEVLANLDGLSNLASIGGGWQGKRMSVLLKNITTDYQLFMKITFYKL